MSNTELIKNLQHALKHLSHNGINKENHHGREWYSGDKARFIRRHNKSIDCLRTMIDGLVREAVMAGKGKA